MSEGDEDPLVKKWRPRISLFNQFGLPMILIVGVIFAGYKFLVLSSPYAVRFVEDHMVTMKALREAADKNSETNERISKAVEQQTVNGTEFVSISKRQGEMLDGISKKVDKLHEVVTKPVKPSGD